MPISHRFVLLIAMAGLLGSCAAAVPTSKGRHSFERNIVVESHLSTQTVASKVVPPERDGTRQAPDPTLAFSNRVGKVRGGNAAPPIPADLPAVEWIDQPQIRPAAAQPRSIRVEPSRLKQTVPKAAVLAVHPARESDPPTPMVVGPLLSDLRRSIRGSEDSPVLKAFNLATLSGLDGAKLDVAADLNLGRRNRQDILRYHKLLLAIRDHLTAAQGRIEHHRMEKWLAEWFDEEPLKIRTLKLVRSVDSYGVYEEFARHEYLAGQDNRVIIYVELDGFKVVQVSNHRFQVHLAQEVELFTDTGVLIWAHPRESVIDDSRNRRRDFFIRQLIRLPKNIGVGKYLLKVRVHDIHGGVAAEQSVPIVIVAAEQLANREP